MSLLNVLNLDIKSSIGARAVAVLFLVPQAVKLETRVLNNGVKST